MPTVFSHIAFPVCAAIAAGTARIPLGMLAVGMLASVAPDFDGLAFKLGIAYGGMWGHRGYTHTLGFAVVLGLLGLFFTKRWGLAPWKAYAWVALCTFSHPIADTLTNGGLAIPLYWPITETRFFSPWTPVEVSPISLKRFFSARGANVLLSEAKVIWLPLLSAALLAFAYRRKISNSIAPRRA